MVDPFLMIRGSSKSGSSPLGFMYSFMRSSSSKISSLSLSRLTSLSALMGRKSKPHASPTSEICRPSTMSILFRTVRVGT